MSFALTRTQAYEFAWAKPMRELATVVGVSDVALANSLRRGGIPVPRVGYWAKLHAGKRTMRPPLPPADLGTPRVVIVSGDLGKGRQLITGEPAEEDDLEPLDVLEARFRKRLGTVRMSPSHEHRDIGRILAKAKRWNDQFRGTFIRIDPLFESKADLRRLGIINALMVATKRAGGHAYAHHSQVRGLEASVFGSSFNVDYVDSDKRTLAVLDGRESSRWTAKWRDDDKGQLEQKLTDILVWLARHGVETHRRVDADMKVVRERDAREKDARRIAAEKAEIEARERRRADVEAQRIRDLVKASTDLRTAEVIRGLVHTVRQSHAEHPGTSDWARWALLQADTIDPASNGSLVEMLDAFAQPVRSAAGGSSASEPPQKEAPGSRSPSAIPSVSG